MMLTNYGLRRRLLFHPSHQGRPNSYSFETIPPPADTGKSPSEAREHPPRPTEPNHLSLSDLQLTPATHSSQSSQPPKRGDVYSPEPPPVSPLYVDSAPRSRRPIQLYASAPTVHMQVRLIRSNLQYNDM